MSKSSVPQLPKLSKPGASRRQMTLPPPVALPDPTLKDRLFNGLAHFGEAWNMTIRAVRVTFHRPFEWREIMAQINSLGIASLGIVFVTSTFIGMVMSAQFAFGLQKFGGMEYTGRVVAISFARELAPTLTAVIVGGRIGAGMTAELGAMAVTEQIDAIQALGADPIKKLVAPRLVASTLVMPILGSVALVLGFSGAMLITDLQFGIPAPFFLGSSLSQLRISDYFLGLLKTPVFGAITAIVACHYGLRTRGGTAGVGQNTTLTVVVTSIGILVADLVLTKLGFTIFGML